MIEAYVSWSIYVRTPQHRKLVEVHIPPIAAALEQLEFVWQIIFESEYPGLFRLVNYQNLEFSSVDEIVSTVLRRAYKLADGWRISGLGDLTTKQIRHVAGVWNLHKAVSTLPALESMIFEVEPGRISGRTADGHGWQIAGRSDTKYYVGD